MKVKFECLNCHHQFEGDDSQEVYCPQCKSDNIRPARGKALRNVLLICSFLLALVVGFFAVRLLKGNAIKESQGPVTADYQEMEIVADEQPSSDMELPIEETQQSTNLAIQEQKIEKEAAKVPVKQPVTLAFKTPRGDADGTYSFSASAEHLPAGVNVTRFVLMNTNNTKEIIASADGQFQHVPASSDRGLYNLKAELSDGQAVTRDLVGGFDKASKIENQMQKEELTTLLNAQNRDLGLGKNPKVIKKPTIVIENSTDENDKQVTIIDDIFSRLEFGSWSSVSVTSVGYDAQGRINKFTIRIN